MKYKFTCAEHQEYGMLGWRLTNMPAFDPLSGIAVAHDVLEHRPIDDSTTGELKALGAMIHVRGEDYAQQKGRRITSPAENMSEELGDLLLKIKWGEWIPLQSMTSRQFINQWNKLEEWVKDEILLTTELVKVYLEDAREELNVITPAIRDRVQYWLAFGYNDALKRYKNVSRVQLLDTFIEIETKADQYLKHAYEGQELIVDLIWREEIMSNSRYADLKVSLTENY